MTTKSPASSLIESVMRGRDARQVVKDRPLVEAGSEDVEGFAMHMVNILGPSRDQVMELAKDHGITLTSSEAASIGSRVTQQIFHHQADIRKEVLGFMKSRR